MYNHGFPPWTVSAIRWIGQTRCSLTLDVLYRCHTVLDTGGEGGGLGVTRRVPPPLPLGEKSECWDIQICERGEIPLSFSDIRPSPSSVKYFPVVKIKKNKFNFFFFFVGVVNDKKRPSRDSTQRYDRRLKNRKNPTQGSKSSRPLPQGNLKVTSVVIDSHVVSLSGPTPPLSLSGSFSLCLSRSPSVSRSLVSFEVKTPTGGPARG